MSAPRPLKHANGTALPLVAPVTLVEMLQRLYAERYTGSIVIHWAQGHPVTLEIPKASLLIKLASPR